MEVTTFEHIEICKKTNNPYLSKKVYPIIKLKVDCNIPKNLQSSMHKRAWFKYILDNNHVISYNKLCGRCTNSLLDSDANCPVCNTPVLSILEADIYYIRIFNEYKFIDISIDSNDDIMKNLYINSRLLYTFTDNYLDVILYMDGIIIEYPTKYDFPEPDSDDIYNILLDESTKILYIVDYGSELNTIKSVEILYKEITPDNIKYVLEVMNKHK